MKKLKYSGRTFSSIETLAGIAFGVILPILFTIMLSLESFFRVEWQRWTMSDIANSILCPFGIWPIFLLMVYSIACFFKLLNQEDLVKSVTIRKGVGLGIFWSIQFEILILIDTNSKPLYK